MWSIFVYILTDVGCYVNDITNENHRNGDDKQSTQNEGTAAAETGSAMITSVSYNGLHNQPKDGARQLEKRRPGMSDSMHFDKRC